MHHQITIPLLLGALPLVAANNVLENDRIRLEVSPQNGSIIHLVNKLTGTDFIGNATQARLFRLALPNPDYTARLQYIHGTREIRSSDQQVKSIAVEDGVLKIQYAKLRLAPRGNFYMVVSPVENPEAPRDIDVTATFRLDGSHVLAQLQVANHTTEQISDVTFPWLSGLATTDQGKPARIIFPSLSRRTMSGVAGGFGRGGGSKSYPGMMATSWLNYEFDNQSVGIEIRTPPETQTANASLGGPQGPSIAWEFSPNIPGQEHWQSQDVAIHVHDSNWHTIAAEHREWQRTHIAAERNNPFATSIGFATYRLKKENNTVNWTYDDIPRLAEAAKLAGIRRIVIDGWRSQEGPANPCPFGEIADPRMGGGERLKALNDQLRRQGVDLIFTFHPTLINTATEQYRTFAHRWTVRSRVQGNQLTTSFVFLSQDYPYEEIGSHFWAQLDPSSPATDYLLKEAKRLRDDYGIRNLFLREIGLPAFLSYNQDTAVPPDKTYAVGYERLLGGLKKLFPDGFLMAEGFNDLVNRWSSAGYTWNQTEDPEVLSWSMPWTPFSNDVETLDYPAANASFARKILINLIVDGGDGTVERYAEFAQHLKALQDLKQATAPYYANAEFRDHEGLKNITTDPQAIVSVFENRSSGQRGVVLTNLSKIVRRVSFELEHSASKGRLFRLSAKPKDVEVTSKFSVDLQPREVLILGLDPS